MKLLLTSAGIRNPSIHEALVGLLGKPIGDCDALCIPTALYAHPWARPRQAWRFISGQEPRCPMVELGWKSLGVLELTALPSLADVLPTLADTVWVSVSAGSMVMTPRVGAEFVTWESPAGDRTLGVVDFSIFPHLEHPDMPTNTMAAAERWAAG